MRNKFLLGGVQGHDHLSRLRVPADPTCLCLPRPPCPGAKVPAPTSTVLATLWACFPGVGSSPGTWEVQRSPAGPRQRMWDVLAGAEEGQVGAQLYMGPALLRKPSPSGHSQEREAELRHPKQVRGQKSIARCQLSWAGLGKGVRTLEPAFLGANLSPSDSQDLQQDQGGWKAGDSRRTVRTESGNFDPVRN